MSNNTDRVACITTAYFPDSHADVIVSRLLGEWGYDPDAQVVSLYTDQVPADDISRDRAAAADVPIYPTIYQAVAADGAGIDGVVVVGEHGDYPWNARRQKLYPRRRFHEEVLGALDDLGLSVPVFNDKHLAPDLEDATWIYRQYDDRGLPLYGGSSVPLTDTVPAVDGALGDPDEILVAAGGGVESYGFHSMEVLQSLAERRAGGETGVEAVAALEGTAVWAAADRGDWPADLLGAALDHARERPAEHPRDRVDVPTLFEVRYRDGLRGYVLSLGDDLGDWVFAARTGAGDPVTGRFDTGRGRPFRHFDPLVANIEEHVRTGDPPVPTERTLLTTLLVDRGMEALAGGEPVATPDLGFGYEV